MRVVNTDNGPLRAWVTGAPFRVVAVDGTDVNEPTEVRDEGVRGDRRRPGGPRLRRPAPARVDAGGGYGAGRRPRRAPTSRPRPSPGRSVDLLALRQPGRRSPFDPDDADRRFDLRIGRRIGFLDGRPGFWWTINGHLFPDVPMFTSQEGDVVRMTISNDSGDVHPMHLHGHHAVVLSRDGVAATGSPWWVDSLNVEDGETYEIAFVADNPGIWMDHCHNLDHAARRPGRAPGLRRRHRAVRGRRRRAQRAGVAGADAQADRRGPRAVPEPRPATRPGVEVKPMFGQLGAFVNGNMFMGLFGGDVGLKLGETEQAELLAKPGAGPFGPAGRPMGG